MRKQFLSLRLLILSSFIAMLALSGCGTSVDPEKAELVLKPANFRSLPGWHRDNHNDVLSAFEKSCGRIMKRSPATPFGPANIGGTYGDWQHACRALESGHYRDAKSFFERHFRPYQATMDGHAEEGLFTGYYEPTLNGSLRRHGPYQYPLRKRPDNLVMVDLGEFREDLKGRRIAGRVTGGRLKPFEERADIMKATQQTGPRLGKPLVWVDDPVEAFFLHIQGSGRINLAEGGFIRVGYAAQNGHPYFAIGRELIRRGELTPETVSLQSIRSWLEENTTQQAFDLMALNKSYVFFRELQENAPIGGEGLPLTPLRSLAVDRSRIPYSVPVWVDIAPVIDHGHKQYPATPPIRRLMVAQDTGGAIRGAVRGDVFWGHGEKAAQMAGRMKSKGRMWLLLPRNRADKPYKTAAR